MRRPLQAERATVWLSRSFFINQSDAISEPVAIDANMKALFIMRGPSSRGKSTTLLSLIEAMERDPYFRKITQESHPNGTDKFYLADTDNGKVAVITAGDPGEGYAVSSYLSRCLDVRVIFAASRTRGSISEILSEFAIANDYAVIDTAPMFTYSDSEELSVILHNTQVASLMTMAEYILNLK